jgi:hypothetical protein
MCEQLGSHEVPRSRKEDQAGLEILKMGGTDGLHRRALLCSRGKSGWHAPSDNGKLV